MPITPVTYRPLPYVRGGSLGELLQMRGRNQAQAELRRGDISAQLWANVGNQLQQAITGYTRERQEAPIRADEAEVRRLQIEASRGQLGDQRREREDRSTMASAMSSRLAPEQVKEQLSALGRGDLIPVYEKTYTDLEAARTGLRVKKKELDALEADYFGGMAAGLEKANYDPMAVEWAFAEAEADGHDVSKYREMWQQNPEQLKVIGRTLIEQSPTQRELRDREAARELSGKAEERQARALEETVASRAADDARQAEALREQMRHNRVIESRPVGATTPVAVMGPDGRPTFVHPSQAIGRQPASTREQGRAVTSGDAGRIAELDTSLDDLRVLRQTVTPEEGEPSPTGTLAKVGASVPNWVTEWTGFGADAKSKQGVIDRVKQVIGKALEGGVLRKEDEYKYEKILPTIGDVPEVVETKLAGLEQAIQLRRERQIEALADAGYDVTRFNARERGPGVMVNMRAPDGRPLQVPAEQVDEAKRRGATVVGQ